MLDDRRHGHSSHADDDDVVHTQPDILRVVQSRYGHVARLPSEETAEHLQAR